VRNPQRYINLGTKAATRIQRLETSWLKKADGIIARATRKLDRLGQKQGNVLVTDAMILRIRNHQVDLAADGVDIILQAIDDIEAQVDFVLGELGL